MRRLFVEHPATVGETYFQHLLAATWFGSRMVIAGLACLFHGLFPFLFARTGSETITQLHDRMVINRHRAPKKEDQSTQPEAPKAFNEA